MPASKLSLRRNGRQQACEPCRKLKNRCDHSIPVCNQCIVRGKQDLCVYHPAPMTKVRDRRMILPIVSPPKLLPELQTLPQTAQSLSPLTIESPRNTLFKRAGPQYATTSFSAVFNENQDQIGADLLDVNGELELERKDYDDPIRMKLATKTLQSFPSHQTCQLLLVPLTTMHDVTISPKINAHCVHLVWSTFGHVLRGLRTHLGLSRMANELFYNGKSTTHPDKHQAWVNWFNGSSLRWEMIGMLFCSFGLSIMRLQDWDPILSLPEWHGHSRKSVVCRMKECADTCLNLRNKDLPTTDLIYSLFRNIGLLHSQIAGDECDELAMYEGLAVSTYIGAGLHCLPEDAPLEPQSEYRKAISASGYRGEKSGALFNARPPALSRFYCSYQIPLDLTEDQLFGTPQELASAVSQLDENGWNTSSQISTTTWLRARCMIVPIREEILEISIGRNMKAAPGRLHQLIENLQTITLSYPPWLQYQNISQRSQQPFSVEQNECYYIVTRLQAEVLQTRFLLERLKKSSSSAREKNQDLFDLSQELMAVTLSLWIDRDHLLQYQSAFHWMAVDYGIPAAGVLCVELLYAARHPYAKDKINMSRSETIQSLTMFVAFLAWVRTDDGNYELCQKLMKVIRNILDHVLDAPLTTTYSEESEAQAGEVTVEANQLDLDWPSVDDQDWLDLLNTVDWTQGFGNQ